MPLTPIPFGGMESLDADELIPLSSALVAENCYIDDGAIRPRNGYRSLTPDPLSLTGLAQGVWRKRDSLTSARTVAAIAGEIFTVTDPLSEITFGTPASAGVPFSATAGISAASLGRYMYLASDVPEASWWRLKPDWTLEEIAKLAVGVPPAFTLSTFEVIKFVDLDAPVLTATTLSTINTDYHLLQPTAVPNSAVYDIGEDENDLPRNWEGMTWAAVIISPSTQSGGDGTVTISASSLTGNFEKIGEIFDSEGAASPCVVFCPLNSLTRDTREGVRKIQFSCNKTNAYIVHAIIPLPTAPDTGPQKYRITFKNSINGQRSRPTEEVTVIYAGNQVAPPSVHGVRGDGNGWRDEGTISLNPDAMSTEICFNKGANLPLPSLFELAAIPTFFGPIPPEDLYPKGDTVELWRLTETQWRLVTSKTYGFGITNYFLRDDQGEDTLTHELYRAGGTPPTASALASSAQRLIAGYENRVFISSFLATSLTTDPFPQFPDIALEDADGWSFDISPAPNEAILSIIHGDGDYILTTEATYCMTSLTPNSEPQRLSDRGALGKRSALWAENSLFYASWDGVYVIQNRSEPVEFSQKIRREYFEWLSPDATATLSYQSRKLQIWCGNRYLRYDFVTNNWTRGITADTMVGSVNFRNPNSRIQNMWLLTEDREIMRWQPGYAVGRGFEAATDNIMPIPAWVYATGYEFTPSKTRVNKFYADATGPLQVQVNTSHADSGRAEEWRRPQDEWPYPADVASKQLRVRIIGTGRASLRRLLWERTAIPGEGVRQS